MAEGVLASQTDTDTPEFETLPRTYSYFPGCSLHSTGLEYGLSTRAVFQHLELELIELPHWNCCGASSAHALNHTLGIALPARNLAIAQEIGHDLVAPCAACFSRMKHADYCMQTDLELRDKIENIVGFEYRNEVAILPAIAVLYEDCGQNKIQEQVTVPLRGVKVVPYYGCLLLRPPQVNQFDDPDDPHVMADLIRAIGAEVMPWSYATDCCGAGLSLIRSDVVESLVDRLVAGAYEAQAQALVTACPLCQINLEMRQTQEPKLPSFYITELLGLAFGLPESRYWWGKHLVDPRPLLNSLGLLEQVI
jgi:heterodisulfide reductase subunit B